MKIFIIVGTSGEYSSQDWWIHSAYLHRSAADAKVKKLTRLANQCYLAKCRIYNSAPIGGDPKHWTEVRLPKINRLDDFLSKYDPHCPYGSVGYDVEEVDCSDLPEVLGV